VSCKSVLEIYGKALQYISYTELLIIHIILIELGNTLAQLKSYNLV